MCMFIKFVHLHTLFNIRHKDKLLKLCKRTKNQEIKKNYKTAMREQKSFTTQYGTRWFPPSLLVSKNVNFICYLRFIILYLEAHTPGIIQQSRWRLLCSSFYFLRIACFEFLINLQMSKSWFCWYLTIYVN